MSEMIVKPEQTVQKAHAARPRPGVVKKEQELEPLTPNKVAQTEPSKNARYLRDKDREMVRGIFRFYESPGFTLSFSFRKYKEDKTERYDLVDNQIYSIPLGVAKHLNTNGAYPIHTYAKDERGNSIQRIGQKIHRFGFQSLEFVDVEELSQTKQIVTVENLTMDSLPRI